MITGERHSECKRPGTKKSRACVRRRAAGRVPARGESEGGGPLARLPHRLLDNCRLPQSDSANRWPRRPTGRSCSLSMSPHRAPTIAHIDSAFILTPQRATGLHLFFFLLPFCTSFSTILITFARASSFLPVLESKAVFVSTCCSELIEIKLLFFLSTTL